MEDKDIITIMGPSGAGKTTIGNMIVKIYDYGVPRHCTTRKQRADDQQGFYRYLEHNEFKKYADDGKYLLWSGDSKVICKENGTFYGILLEDCEEKLLEKKKIIPIFQQVVNLSEYSPAYSFLSHSTPLTFSSIFFIIREQTSCLQCRNAHTSSAQC